MKNRMTVFFEFRDCKELKSEAVYEYDGYKIHIAPSNMPFSPSLTMLIPKEQINNFIYGMEIALNELKDLSRKESK